MRTTLFVAAAAFVCLTARSQDLSVVFPELKELPAPAIIEEGLRLNYYGSVGDIPNDDYPKWPDETGDWVYGTAPSGHGWTQVDVVTVAPPVVALSVQTWQYYNWTGPLVPIRGGQSGLVCSAGGGDWWVHPQVLAGIEELRSDELTIIRLNQVIDGNSRPALRIQRVTPEARQVTVYDLDTGLLLFKNAAVRTGQTTFASQMFYKGSRKLPFATGGSAIPSWLKPGLRLVYRGTYNSQVAGGSNLSLPLEALLEVQTVGDRWFAYDQTTTLTAIQGMPPTVEKTSLVGPGNIYVAPQILHGLNRGAVLDSDPVTQAQLRVAATGEVLTLQVTVGSVSLTEFSLDSASGLVIEIRTWDGPSPWYQIESQVTLVQSRSAPGS